MKPAVVVKTSTVIPVSAVNRFNLSAEQADAIDRALSLVYDRLLALPIKALLRLAYIQGMEDARGIIKEDGENTRLRWQKEQE